MKNEADGTAAIHSLFILNTPDTAGFGKQLQLF
jgi:hypothetical protein